MDLIESLTSFITGGGSSSSEKTQKVEIVNEEFNEWYTCENSKRTNSYWSATIISAVGLAQTIKYADRYGDVIKWRDGINRNILLCAQAEVNHWCKSTYPFGEELYWRIRNTPIPMPDFDNPLGEFAGFTDPDELAKYYGLDDIEHRNTLVLAKVNAAVMSIANANKREEQFRQTRAASMSASIRANYARASTGREMMGISMDIANSLAAMAANGLNGGLATMGRGIGMFFGEHSN